MLRVGWWGGNGRLDRACVLCEAAAGCFDVEVGAFFDLLTPVGGGLDLGFGLALDLVVAFDFGAGFVFGVGFDFGGAAFALGFGAAFALGFATAALLLMDVRLGFATPLLSRGLLRDGGRDKVELELESFLLSSFPFPLPLALVMRSLLLAGVAMDLAEESGEEESIFDTFPAAAAASDLELRSRVELSGVLSASVLDDEIEWSFFLIHGLESGNSLALLTDRKWAEECRRNGSRQNYGEDRRDGNVLTLEDSCLLSWLELMILWCVLVLEAVRGMPENLPPKVREAEDSHGLE